MERHCVLALSKITWSTARVCSAHFVSSARWYLRPDEYPTLNLPVLTTPVRKRKSPKQRKLLFTDTINSSNDDSACSLVAFQREESGIQTDITCDKIQSMLSHTEQLERRVLEIEKQLTSQLFRLSNTIDEPQKILFYTGFPDYATLRACYDYLGPAVNKLNYWGSVNSSNGKKNSGRTRSLPPLEEFFLVLVRFRLGLFERDLGDRFGISLSTVSRICITWINFLYIKLKEIPMWPKQESVHSCMPACFKQLYPTTRVIIDATEIFIETPSLPELQQMTYSSYKNHNMYKALIGISPGGAITFVSKLFPGSISDKELTRKSGLPDLLQGRDSVMADRGFDIQDDLTPLGVKVNIPPFLKGKKTAR